MERAAFSDISKGQRIELICRSRNKMVKFKTSVVTSSPANGLLIKAIRSKDNKRVRFDSTNIHYSVMAAVGGNLVIFNDVGIKPVVQGKAHYLVLTADPESALENRRKARRYPANCSGTLYLENSAEPVTILNLSATGIGFELKSNRNYAPGSMLTVMVRDHRFTNDNGNMIPMKMECRVVRQSGNVIGCELARKPKAFAAYLQQQREAM